MKKLSLIISLLITSISVFAVTWYSPYGGSPRSWTKTISKGETYTMEIDKITTYKTTYWYVNKVRQSGQDDKSGFLADDPTFTYTFNTVGTILIQGDVYNRHYTG